MAVTPIRWGILSTANIARSSFLPALRQAGDGVASAVAGRDPARAGRFAAENGIDRALTSYHALVEDEDIDAIYNPLPNSLHAEWTIRALQAGKAVLCEKPLCVSAEETAQVLAVARETGSPLWEAFVFPFRHQSAVLLDLLGRGEIGEVREVQSSYNYKMKSRDDIRLDPTLGGGGLYDVGCYCIRFARMVFGGDAQSATAVARWTATGVDDELQGILTFSDDRRLLFSSGMARPDEGCHRILGTEGRITLTNPFHPNAADTVTVEKNGEIRTLTPSADERSFTPALLHIHAVLRGEEEPQHLAVDEAMGNAEAIDMLYGCVR